MSRLMNLCARAFNYCPRAFDYLPLELTVRLQYRRHTGRWPNLRDPQRFTEKVQIRKLYDRDPRFAKFTDKITVKDHISAVLGPEWIIPTLYYGDDLPPMHERNWPVPYVIKAAHGCGWNHFVRDEPDWPSIEEGVRYWLSHDYGTRLGEWHYGQVPRRILIEPFIGDGDSLVPIEYKFYVFSWRVHCIKIHTGRFVDLRRAFYSPDWKDMGVKHGNPVIGEPIDKPKNIDRMLEAARELGRNFSFVLVDLYEVDGEPKFGELTFLPASGFTQFKPDLFDYELGQQWKEPELTAVYQ